ncbi:MAG: hypothetical protein HY741_26335 [Chloroflexi bacterium]|nr:hypothetical protein [Chloroflexota bacterium]
MRTKFQARLQIVIMLVVLLLMSFALNSSTAAQGPSGEIVADLGFRPEANGFPFENYGSDKPYTNLTPDEMRRLFGDAQVCASTEGGQCILHPQVEQMMKQWNDGMAGGHCYGFSVAALRLYTNEIRADSTFVCGL